MYDKDKLRDIVLATDNDHEVARTGLLYLITVQLAKAKKLKEAEENTNGSNE